MESKKLELIEAESRIWFSGAEGGLGDVDREYKLLVNSWVSSGNL